MSRPSAAKTRRRTRRFGGRPSRRDPVTGRMTSRRTGRRGRRLSETQQLALVDAGAARLLGEVAKLPQPKAVRAGWGRAERDAQLHRSRWAWLDADEEQAA